jgi:predicted nucleic acid-binding protein
MSVEGGPAFTDTNILVYAMAGDDCERSPVAQDLLRELTRSNRLRTSMQVLQELFVTLTGKGRGRLEPGQALRYLDRIARHPVVLLDYPAIRDAVELCESDSFSFWDALIVVAAARSGASILYTEDLQHGRVIREVKIVNPFKKTA